MGFVEAIKSGFSNYATFRGRASRSEYWWWALFAGLASGVGSGIDAVLGSSSAQGGVGVVGGLVSLALILPGLAVFVRRLHDTDHSGWWYFLVLTIIGLIPLFIWSVQRGTLGQNRFGPDPLGGMAAGGYQPYGYVPQPQGNMPQGYAPQPQGYAPQSNPNMAAVANAPTASQKLEELARLRDQGLITQAEFDEHKKNILGAF